MEHLTQYEDLAITGRTLAVIHRGPEGLERNARGKIISSGDWRIAKHSDIQNMLLFVECRERGCAEIFLANVRAIEDVDEARSKLLFTSCEKKGETTASWTSFVGVPSGARNPTIYLPRSVPVFDAGDDPDSPVEGQFGEFTGQTRSRSAKARKDCIEHFGSTCKVCGLDFEALYGKRGKGFIHVHHLNPMAGAEGPRPVDPKKDLIPVCPNCHAMLHRGRAHTKPWAPRDIAKGMSKIFLPSA